MGAFLAKEHMETAEFITQELLHAIFTYDNEWGTLTRKITLSSKAKIGGDVGYINTNGYLEVMLFSNKYLVHRLIWVYVYGKFPDEFIDHIDGDTLNNSISNLREANNQQNNFNSRKKSTNTSGYIGVTLDKRCNKWRSYITFNGKQISLGYYPTAKDASIARELKAKELHGEFYRENTS